MTEDNSRTPVPVVLLVVLTVITAFLMTFPLWGQRPTAALYVEYVKAMNSPEARAWYETNGAVVYASTPEQLTQMMRESTEVYRKIVSTVGLKPE